MAGYGELEDLKQRLVDELMVSNMAHNHFTGSLAEGFRSTTTPWLFITGPGPAAMPGDSGFPRAIGWTVHEGHDASGAVVDVGWDPGADYDTLRSMVRDAFEGWDSLPDPSGLTGQSDVMNGAVEHLAADASVSEEFGVNGGNARLADLGLASAALVGMSGGAVTNLNRNYVSRLPVLFNGQASVSGFLSTMALAQHGILSRARDDVADIAEKAITAARAARPESGGSDVKAILSTTLALAGIAGGFAPPPAGTLIGAGAGVAGILVGFLPEEAPAREKSVPLGATHPGDVVTNVARALDALNSEIVRQERACEKALQLTQREVHHDPGSFDLSAPTRFLGNTDPDTYVAEDVDVSYSLLRDIANIYLRTAATELDRAAARLGAATASDAWTRPAGIGISTTGFYNPWQELKLMQGNTLRDSSAEVRSVASHLRDWADHIEGVDLKIQEHLQGLEKNLVTPQDTKDNPYALRPDHRY